MEYQGKWRCDVDYNLNDVVLYQNSSYISLVCHNSSEPSNKCKWGALTKALYFEGNWDCEEEYDVNDIVTYSGSSYISIKCDNTAIPTDECHWSLLAKKGKSLDYEGDWNDSSEYELNDVVSYNGGSYVSKVCDNTASPTDTDNWGVIALPGAVGVYGNVYESRAYNGEMSFGNSTYSTFTGSNLHDVSLSNTTTLSVDQDGDYYVTYFVAVVDANLQNSNYIILEVDGNEIQSTKTNIVMSGYIQRSSVVHLTTSNSLKLKFSCQNGSSIYCGDCSISLFRLDNNTSVPL